MSDFLANLGSWYWWLSVVIVGMLINVASHFLSKRLDVGLSSVSSRWRKRSEAKKAFRLKEVNKLRNNQHEQTMLAFSEMRDHSSNIRYLLWGAVLFLLSLHLNEIISRQDPTQGKFTLAFILKLVAILTSAISVLTAMSFYLKARDKGEVIKQARQEDEQENDA